MVFAAANAAHRPQCRRQIPTWAPEASDHDRETHPGLRGRHRLRDSTPSWPLCAKIFSRASIGLPGAASNTRACAVDLALPGTLLRDEPRGGLRYRKLGLALAPHCAREHFRKRKNYFYPDPPKGYQISQSGDSCAGGEVGFYPATRRRPCLVRAHPGGSDRGKPLHENSTA